MSAYIFWTQRGQARPYADYFWNGMLTVKKDKPREAVIGELAEATGMVFAVESHEPFEPHLHHLEKIQSDDTSDVWEFSIRKEWEG